MGLRELVCWGRNTSWVLSSPPSRKATSAPVAYMARVSHWSPNGWHGALTADCPGAVGYRLVLGRPWDLLAQSPLVG